MLCTKIILSDLQVVLLLARPCILVHPPFDVSILILQCSASYLKTSHRHSRPNLRQLHTLVASLDKDVMPNLDAVVDILESYHAAAQLRLVCDGFPWWKDVLQHFYNALAETRGEPLEYQMWIGFRDGASR